MSEEVINLPMNEKIKEILRIPSIICVTPKKKGDNFLKGEDEQSSDDWGLGNFNSSEDDSSYDYGSCKPTCPPCSPCRPHATEIQCYPEQDSCYPDCSPCNPCFPCNPVDER